MADTHRDPGSESQTDETAVGPDRGPSAGMPRWVKTSLIVALALVLLFVVAQVTVVGGDHGPGRHGGGGDTPSSGVDEDAGHRPPVDHGP